MKKKISHYDYGRLAYEHFRAGLTESPDRIYYTLLQCDEPYVVNEEYWQGFKQAMEEEILQQGEYIK